MFSHGCVFRICFKCGRDYGSKVEFVIKGFLSESLLSTVISPPLSEREFRHEIRCIGVVLLSLFEFTIVYDVSIVAKLVIFCSLFKFVDTVRAVFVC